MRLGQLRRQPSTGARGSFRLRVAGAAVCALGAIAASAPLAFATEYPVTTTDDSGAGSLRDAITSANAHPGLDTITFAIGTGPQTIQPGSSLSNPQEPLPIVTDPVVIDGTTQPGYSGTPLIRIDNSAAAAGSSALRITGGSSTVRGLEIYNVNEGDAIDVSGQGGNRFTANYLCTDGTHGCGDEFGILIAGGSSGNTVGGTTAGDRNLIGGFYGVYISGTGTNRNRVQGNYIGLNAGGLRLIGIGGVLIANGASGNTIGGTAAGARNVISNASEAGVEIFGANGNRVQGNYIGTDVAGTFARGNGRAGVLVGAGSPDGHTFVGSKGNTIGGTAAGAGNVISGNPYDGVVIRDPGTSQNKLQGNFIGTDATGMQAMPNSRYGVIVSDGATDNRIGGLALRARNLIANNPLGVRIDGAGTVGNAILRNSIFANDGLGIALSRGGNDDEPAPTIVSVTRHDGAARIAGTASAGRHRIEVFANPTCADPEGKRFIGSVITHRGAWRLTTQKLQRGEGVTATATKTSTSNTSQFSRCVAYGHHARGK